MALATGTFLNNRYSIERTLGSGGFGVTYIGWDSHEGCRVAIKENFPSFLVQRDSAGRVVLSGDIRSYRCVLRHFITEAELLSNKLHHPNIVRGYGIVQCNNTAYFIMEYIDGTPLANYRRPSEWTESSLRRILIPLLDAVCYMQSRNISHRDIKPANIMIRPNGEPVLIDFGAAKYEQSTASYTIGFMTTGYSAPEQIADYDCLLPSIDVYALAATCYCLLTGAAPEPAPNRMLSPGYDTYAPLTSFSHLTNSFSREFLNCIDSALQLDYQSRITARQWLNTLRSGNSQPSSAAPSWFRKLFDWFSSSHAATARPEPQLPSAPRPAPAPKPMPRPYQPAGSLDDEIPLSDILLWVGRFCYIAGGTLFVAILFSLFSGTSAGSSLDSFFPLALACIICGLICSFILRFFDFSD